MVRVPDKHKRAKSGGSIEKGNHLFIGRQASSPFVYTLGHVNRESNMRFLCQDKIDKEWFERLYHEELAKLGTVEAAENGEYGARKGDPATSSLSASGSLIVDLTVSEDEAPSSPLAAHSRKRPKVNSPTTSAPTAAVRTRPPPNPRLFPFNIPPMNTPLRPYVEPLHRQKLEAKAKLSR